MKTKAIRSDQWPSNRKRGQGSSWTVTPAEEEEEEDSLLTWGAGCVISKRPDKKMFKIINICRLFALTKHTFNL
jgi:hypothetical protein